MQKPVPKRIIRNEILAHALWPLMIRLSIPGILGMMVMGVNTFVDALFVGQFVGETGLAAISLAFPLTFLIGGFATMIGMGSASILSRAIGAQDIDTQEKIFGNLVLLTVGIGIGYGALSYALSREMIALMGGSGAVLDVGTSYFQVRSIGGMWVIPASALNLLVRSEGKIKEAMIFSSATMILNMLLNPIAILVFDAGVEGVAWATNIAGVVYLVLNFGYFYQGYSTFPVNPKRYQLAPELIPEILSIGISAMMLQVMAVVQQAFIFRSIAHYGGDADIAFMGACFRIVTLGFLPLFGIMQALQPVVGMNYGAQQFQRTAESLKVFTLGGMALLLVLCIPALLLPETVLSWLLPGRSFSSQDLFLYRLMLILLPLNPIIFCSVSFYQAIGNAAWAGGILIGRQLVLFVPTLLLFSYVWGIPGIYWSLAAMDLVSIVAILLMLRVSLSKLKRMANAQT